MYLISLSCVYQVQRLRDDFKKEESADSDADFSTATPLK